MADEFDGCGSSEEEAAEERQHAHLTKEELREFREIFNLVDVDGGGTISKEELKTLMATLGFRPSEAELSHMVAEIDVDGDGEIDFDEFVSVMSRRVACSHSVDEIKAAFETFRQPHQPAGHVSMAQLEMALTSFGAEKLSVADAHELLSQVTPDQDGLINYVEFVDIMAAGGPGGT